MLCRAAGIMIGALGCPPCSFPIWPPLWLPPLLPRLHDTSCHRAVLPRAVYGQPCALIAVGWWGHCCPTVGRRRRRGLSSAPFPTAPLPKGGRKGGVASRARSIASRSGARWHHQQQLMSAGCWAHIRRTPLSHSGRAVAGVIQRLWTAVSRLGQTACACHSLRRGPRACA